MKPYRLLIQKSSVNKLFLLVVGVGACIISCYNVSIIISRKEQAMNSTASRVLIVDDMPINRMILSSMLATNGVMSDQAESGSRCISLCENNDYDLILLDHRMPDLDGVDTFVVLKELFARKGVNTPVVCHTTEEGRDIINLYKAAGFADVLIKPIDPRQLSEVIMTYLPEEDKITASEEKLPEPQEPQESNEEVFVDTDTRDEIEKLPMWLKTIPHLDLVTGITNSGSAEDYLYSLYIFYSSIEDKCDEIKTHYDNSDLTMYKLCVHSLKSMARLIGARALFKSAAALEASAESGNLDSINRDTVNLLSSYRKFSDALSPISDDATIRRLVAENERSKETEAPKEVPKKTKKTVLFIHSSSGIVSKGIENNLSDAGFKVITIPDDPGQMIANRQEADIILYYPASGDESHIGLTMNLLGEICTDDSKVFCLTGDHIDLEKAMAASGAQRVTRTYKRPVSIHTFLSDMEYYSYLIDEYRQPKTIFVVDDDSNYLSVIDHWLSSSYQVSCFTSGKDLISGLSATMPDLILLDYEMPEMDGRELIKNVRSNPATEKIPIIFLTGKNDRDHVFRILEYKPDGYLLKTSQREALTDAIHRFFSETFFKKTQH